MALVLVAAGSGLTVFMTSAWQLLLCWGLLVGVGTGSMSMALVATVSGRWFVARRGLVSGILTAATATGQLVFLPVVAALTDHHGWRPAAVTVTVAALAVVPLVLLGDARSPARPGHSGLRRNRVRPRTGARAALGQQRQGRARARCSAPSGPGCSGCWPAASPSAARPRTA